MRGAGVVGPGVGGTPSGQALKTSAHISRKRLSPPGTQSLSPRAVHQTPFRNPNFLFRRVLRVADLAYSLRGELISGWGIKKNIQD